MNKKRFILDGNNFNSIDSFYDEVNKILCPNFKHFGRNLNAFSDILVGGFEEFEYEENIDLIWKNSEKSMKDFGPRLNVLIEIIKENKNVGLFLE